MCNFGSLKNPFVTITSLPELYFRFRRFILLVQPKKRFLWAMAAAEAAENHGDEWGFNWYLRWGIYTSIPTWTHSQNSLAAVEALSLKIFFHWTPLKWSLKKNFSQRKISVFTINANKISKKYMIILPKEYASEAGVSGKKKMKNRLNFS